MIPGQDSGTFDTDASSPVPRNVAASVCRSVCETILSSTAPRYLTIPAPLSFCTGTETTGLGELGGLVVDLDRGFRVDLTAPEAGVWEEACHSHRRCSICSAISTAACEEALSRPRLRTMHH